MKPTPEALAEHAHMSELCQPRQRADIFGLWELKAPVNWQWSVVCVPRVLLCRRENSDLIGCRMFQRTLHLSRHSSWWFPATSFVVVCRFRPPLVKQPCFLCLEICETPVFCEMFIFNQAHTAASHSHIYTDCHHVDVRCCDPCWSGVVASAYYWAILYYKL